MEITESIGLPASHLRRPKATRQADLDSDRCYYGEEPEASCSTHALLILLAVWAVTLNEDRRRAAAAMLRAFLRQFLVGEVLEFTIALDRDVRQIVGLLPSGDRCHNLVAQGIELQVDTLFAVDDRIVNPIATALLPECINGKIDLIDALAILSRDIGTRRSIRTSWFLEQLVYNIGSLIDDMLFEKGCSTDPSIDLFRPRKCQRRDADHEEIRILGIDGAEEDGEASGSFRAHGHWNPDACIRIAGKYVLSSWRQFHEAIHVKMAVDCATIGDLDALCGMITSGSSGCLASAWLAPQACFAIYS